MISAALTVFIALQHVGFALLEIVLWQKPYGLKTFGNTAEKAKDSAVLAANQGVYNLFLAAGLLASLWLPEPTAHAFRLFFVSCVLIAGIVGGLTAKMTILFVQGLPAAIALAVILAGY